MCGHVCITSKTVEIHKFRVCFPFFSLKETIYPNRYYKVSKGKHTTPLLNLSLNCCSKLSTPLCTRLFYAMGHRALHRSRLYDLKCLGCSISLLSMKELFSSYYSFIEIILSLAFHICPAFQENTPIHIICSSPNPSFRVHLPKEGFFVVE